MKGKDIAWKQIGIVGGTLLVGIALGVKVVAPWLDKRAEAAETAKNEADGDADVATEGAVA